jgi:hypothetical protein
LRINQSRLNSGNVIKEYKIKALLVEPTKRERKKKVDIGKKPLPSMVVFKSDIVNHTS